MTEAQTPCHLFLLVPPCSGSTALWRFLQTSPNVAAFELEGQWLPEVKPILGTKQRWDPLMPVDWSRVRAAWEREWGTRAAVRLEKSPPHLVRAHALRANFADARFVVMVRDPYAACEGHRRRWTPDVPIAQLAEQWCARVAHQVQNQRLPRAHFLTYERFTADPRGAADALLKLVPELGSLDPAGTLRVHERDAAVSDMNQRQWDSLSEEDVAEMNGVFERFEPTLRHFGYRLRTYADLRSGRGQAVASGG